MSSISIVESCDLLLTLRIILESGWPSIARAALSYSLHAMTSSALRPAVEFDVALRSAFDRYLILSSLFL